jgi:hypothetical protein
MNALEAASLVMIPSGYEDGTLGSLKPTDGTGDFTFSRGSNISATRVNADGNIEKGYENILLQSNSFTTTWANINSTETSGQQGYDGYNNAWLLESTQDGTSSFVYQSVSQSGVQTFSVYAKAGTADYLAIYVSTGARAWFNLSNGTIGYQNSTIDKQIQDVGNGWYRCSISYNASIADVRFYIADANNSFNSVLGSSVFIQDAMVNQGMAAYPYVETTTAPVAGGILEDMPRLDYSNGSCPSLLLEPSRTNLITSSEYFGAYTNSDFTLTTNDSTSPEGLTNATLFEATGTSAKYIEYNLAGAGTYTQSYFFKKGATSGYPSLSMFGLASNDYETGVFDFDAKTFDETSGSITSFTNVSYDYEDFGNGWFRIWQTFTASKTNQRVRIVMFNEPTPTLGSIGQRNWTASGESFSVYGWQTEAGSYPTSYIPTYGVSQTRLVETTDTLTLPQPLGTDFTIFIDTKLFQDGNGLIQFLGASVGVYKIYSYANHYDILNLQNGQFLVKTDAAPNGKIALSQSGSTIKIYVNGQEKTKAGAVGNTTEITKFRINQTSVGSNICLLNQMIIFPTALSDDECITLTTI